jgi:hypothetical protein
MLLDTMPENSWSTTFIEVEDGYVELYILIEFCCT